MVLIESPEVDEEILVKDQRGPSETTGLSIDTRAKEASNDNGDESDGFETASEREVSGEEEDREGGGLNDDGSKENPEPVEEKVKGRVPFEDASNEDGSKQKSLMQANDAKLKGNELFGKGLYEEALSQYELALQVAPEMPASSELRSICHSNQAGKYEETIKECTKALELNPLYVKALVRRGEAHEKLEHYEEAITDLKKILELDPSNDQARRSIRRLEPLAEEKREKLKEEMMAKLKEMGNSILGRFGMSVDNFKAVKDPNTGSYSISFQN